MLQVYDRVLGSRSEETLVSLLILVILLYVLMGLLEYSRGRVAARVGARFQSELDGKLFSANLALSATNGGGYPNSLKDLESIQRLLSSNAVLALFDLPWAPVFILAVFVFHPLLGWCALAGAALLIVIAIFNQHLSQRPVGDASTMSTAGYVLTESLQNKAEIIRGLGMEKKSVRALAGN